MRPTLVSVSGLYSEVGKTTLMCRLLARLPGWEAVKITRGHRRSCGRDPETCCVSPMLGEAPLVLSGRADTFQAGKDTGRYWEAGAGNVHWVIATSEQVEEGLRVALGRIQKEGVVIEGNSFLKHVGADYSIMVADTAVREIKSSAVRIMPRVNAVFVNSPDPGAPDAEAVRNRLKTGATLSDKASIFFENGVEKLVAEVLHAHSARNRD